MTLIKFERASVHEEDGRQEYEARGPIWINPAAVATVEDHRVNFLGGGRIYVTEDAARIVAKLKRGEIG